MLVTALNPRFYRNKLYYGNALVIKLNNGVKMLQSNETITCIILPEKEGRVEVIMPFMDWSRTTGRHTSDFLMQNNIFIKNLTRLGFSSFASFMREVGNFTWDVKEEKIVEFNGYTWACEYQKLDKAINEFKGI